MEAPTSQIVTLPDGSKVLAEVAAFEVLPRPSSYAYYTTAMIYLLWLYTWHCRTRLLCELWYDSTAQGICICYVNIGTEHGTGMVPRVLRKVREWCFWY